MNFNKKLAVAVSGAVLLMAGQFALADSATDIVDALVSKGVLTEEEGKLITKGHTSKTAVTPVVKEKDGSFTLESANGRNSIQLTGRMHLDYRNSDINNLHDNEPYAKQDLDSRTLADQFELRRARLGVKGKFAKYFNYEVVGNLPGTATLDVAYLDFTRYDAVNARAGKFKQPVGLEQLTSSNNIDFMERSYVDQLVPAKKQGAMLMGAPATGMTYAGSVYQMNDTENDMDSDKASYAGRLTYNFAEAMGNKEMIAHVGLSGFDAEYSVTPTTSGNTSKVNDGKTRASILAMRSGGRGLANMYRTQIGGETLAYSGIGGSYNLSNPTTAQVQSKAYGLEGIFAYGPLKLQGEFMNNDIKGDYKDSKVESDVDAWYAEALWLVTGEKYADSYKKGVFGSIKPKNELDLDTGNGGWGAIELGFRVDSFDAKSKVQNGATAVVSRVQGSTPKGTHVDSCENTGASTAFNCGKGGATSYTAGIKWILNPNVLFKVNYTHTKFDEAFAPLDIQATTSSNRSVAGGLKMIDSENLLMVRTQYTF
jgi:phosphate-selective porin OprO/OprP